MFKNKNVRIAIGVVLGVVLLLGGLYFFANRSTSVPVDKTSNENAVQTIKPEEIGLKMEASPDKKKVKFSIKKADGIKSMEYELVYEADLPPADRVEGGEDRVTRQVAGDADIKAGDSSYASQWLDLGSCSKAVCKYDQGVTKIDITLKIVKSDNKVYQVIDSLNL
jgi:hypothetical protein